MSRQTTVDALTKATSELLSKLVAEVTLDKGLIRFQGQRITELEVQVIVLRRALMEEVIHIERGYHGQLLTFQCGICYQTGPELGIEHTTDCALWELSQ